MKLFASFSEAIREGAKLRQQAFCPSATGRSCAIQAGLEALTGRIEWPTDYALAEETYPYLKAPAKCPECGTDAILTDATYHLNDEHKWTRERIADWLETEEEKLGYITVIEAESEAPAFASVGGVSQGSGLAET